MPEDEKIQAPMSQEHSEPQQPNAQQQPNTADVPQAQQNIEVPKPTEGSHISDPNNSKSQESQLNRYERWSLVVNSLTMLAVSIYAYFAWGQWTSLIDQVNLSTRHLEMTERPWVGPTTARLLSLEPLKPIRFTMDFQNSGKSPAFGVHIVVMNVAGVPPTTDVHSMRTPQNTACEGWPDISRDGPMVLPGTTYGIDFLSDPLPTEADTEAVLKGSVGMYLLGCLTYWDAFGKRHHTKFCQFFSPSEGRFNYCQDSNYAD